MIPRGVARMEEWSREFYRLCRQIGLTKNQLGVTPHSLRHGVLLDLYEHLAGIPAPVRGGTDAPVQPHKEREVRTIVAEFAGHSRPQVSSAYLGSRRQRRSAKRPAENSKHAPSHVPTPEAPRVSHDPSADTGGSDTTQLWRAIERRNP
jgi:integrase